MSDFMTVKWDNFVCQPDTDCITDTTMMKLDSNYSMAKETIENQENCSPNEQQQGKRRVHFGHSMVSSVLVMEDDYQQTDAIWYSSKEFQDATKGLQAMLQAERMKISGRSPRNNKRPGPKNCINPAFRGLEDLLSIQSIQDRRERQTAVLRGVLLEQARQTSLNIVEAERIGETSEVASKSSRDIALMRGSLDVLAAYPFGVSSSYYRKDHKKQRL
jgi:hypothetical protein